MKYAYKEHARVTPRDGKFDWDHTIRKGGFKSPHPPPLTTKLTRSKNKKTCKAIQQYKQLQVYFYLSPVSYMLWSCGKWNYSSQQDEHMISRQSKLPEGR
jgi:hypothetical protein